ncbi:hypothetical protein FRC12_022199 [Ceratobasidium sp. 428]|nr:hypothetical protein FRC12_022199 [Ceratobasidium sp. 428]
MPGFEFLWGSNGDDLDGSPPVAYDGGTTSNVGQHFNHEGLTTQYLDYSNKLTPIDSPSGQFLKDAPAIGAHTIPDFYFVVLDNIYRRSSNGIVQLHQELAPPAPITIVPNLVRLDSTFSVGTFCFYLDSLGQLYWIRELGDNNVEVEWVPTFDTEDDAWASLGIVANPTSSLSQDNAPGSPGGNVFNPGSGGVTASPSKLILGVLGLFHTLIDPSQTVVCTPDLTSSPNTSESCTSDWISASPGEQQLLFFDPGSGILTNDSVVGDSSPPTTSPLPLPLPSPPKVFETLADVDKYYKWVKEQRRHRGTGSSKTVLNCPGCGKPQRRPLVLRVS